LVVRDGSGAVIGIREREFRLASNRPGLGASFFGRFKADFFPLDHAVVDGREVAVPRYYGKLLKRCDPAMHADVVERRAEVAVAAVRASVKSHGSREKHLEARESVVVSRDRFFADASSRSGTERGG